MTTRYILLEEEAPIRARWQAMARERGLVLAVYDSPAAFLRDLGGGRFDGSCRFYLDQDFGEERGLGTRFARAVRAYLPKSYVSLVTGYPKWMFRDELASGLLDEVHGKFPDPFGDADYRKYEDWYDAEVWAPFREFYEEAVMSKAPGPRTVSARQ
jgi:hypothetical protein